jgi:hypothetical protein
VIEVSDATLVERVRGELLTPSGRRTTVSTAPSLVMLSHPAALESTFLQTTRISWTSSFALQPMIIKPPAGVKSAMALSEPHYE